MKVDGKQMDNKTKRGLVIVYDPHTLQQFAWYYYTHGKDVKWDALCLPDGYKGAYMVPYCQRSELFETVMSGKIDYLALPLKEKAKLFGTMVVYFLAGKREKCAKKILNTYVEDIDAYDEILSICDTGFISGLCAMLGKDRKVAYLDDGLGDYNSRTKWSNTYKKTSSTYWQSLLLTRMGYSCKGRFYFEPTKYCYKYSAVTSEMKYRNYKEMSDFDMTNTDVEGYNEALRKAYPEIETINFDEIDAVFFSDNLEVFSSNYQEYYDKCASYVGERHKKVLLKRHPRDGATYNFGPDVKVVEVDNAIPAEIILPYLEGKKIYFTIFSSIIIFMQQYKYKYKVFYSDKMYQENLAQKGSTWKFLSREDTIGLSDRFAKEQYEVIDV